eukprot:TRINITY_DN421_c0_g1_i3.p1 TRINITY_DN421_c0_g1~~TRINITY_DN421_c0_g1_i3.p1  ORF type:complete len:294 (+),score=70.31 TRINITY_DN421_c0_g1_i3:169-1050(+)
MAMNQTLGTFGTPGFTSVGDEYDKKVSSDVRTKGKQFSTSPPKKGQLPSNYFDKQFKPLYEGEKYEMPGSAERRDRKKQAERVLAGTFKPSSPPKRSSGSGNYYGCIGGVYTHEKEFETEKARDTSPQPKNVLTNPSRKGTFGVPNTTIGKSFEYVPDPYESVKKKEIDERKASTSRNVAGPFKGMSHGLDFFDSQPNVAASRVYTIDKPIEAREEAPKKEAPIPTPFKPSSPPKIGYNSTLQRFPEYKEDPFDLRAKMEREERAKTKPAVVFKPVSNPKSSATRSIMFHAPH